MTLNLVLKKHTYLMCAVLLAFTACKKNNSPDPDPPVNKPTKEAVTATINTALAGKDTLSQFAAQIKLAGLTDAEVKDGITVFAPSNEAYKLKVSSLKRVMETPPSGNYLPDSSLVKDYIISVTVDFSKLQSGTTYTALSGKKLTLTKVGNNWYLNGIFLNISALANDKGTVVFSIAGLLNANTVPHITGTSDTKTFPGWLLTIYGRNLDTAATKNLVKMDGKDALVHKASTDSLVITVPQGVTAGAISVTVRGRTLTVPQNVTIQAAHVEAIARTSGGPIQGIAVSSADSVVWIDNIYDGNPNTLPRLGTYTNRVKYYSPSFPNPNGNGTTVSILTNSSLWAIAVDHDNKVYYSNTNNGLDTVNTFTGIWRAGDVSAEYMTTAEWWAGKNAISTAAGTKDQLRVRTTAMAIDAQNNLYLINGGAIQKITPAGSVSIDISPSTFKSVDANVIKNFSSYGMAFSKKGDLYISDNANGRVWVREATGGRLYVLAGNNTVGAKDGIGTTAQFGAAFGLTVDKKGNVYICDNDYSTSKYLIRMINPKGVVTTIAGNANNTYTDGVGTAAGFNGVNAIAVDSKGVLYVGTDIGVVKKITIQ